MLASVSIYMYLCSAFGTTMEILSVIGAHRASGIPRPRCSLSSTALVLYSVVCSSYFNSFVSSILNLLSLFRISDRALACLTASVRSTAGWVPPSVPLTTVSAMPAIHTKTAAPGFVAAPTLSKLVSLFRVFLIISGLFYSPLPSTHFTITECRASSGRELADLLTADDGKNDADGRNPGGALAAKVFGFVSNVVGEVGTEVKNSVLHGISKLRTSQNYKKAKYLLRAPDVTTNSVNERLQTWGTESLRFLHDYTSMPLDARAVYIQVAFDEIPQLGKFQRKYGHLGELPNTEGFYKSLLAVRAMLEARIVGSRREPIMHVQRMKTHPRNAGNTVTHFTLRASIPDREDAEERRSIEESAVESPKGSENGRTAQLLELVIRQLPRILFYYIHAFSSYNTLGNELALYLGKMLPLAKVVFSLAWRLNSVLPANAALANKRMMVDYLEDVLEFEEGLRAACEMRTAYPSGYDATTEYYYIPPPNPNVLETLPLRDVL